MIECAARQWQYGHAERVDVGIFYPRFGAQGPSEGGVHVIVCHLAVVHSFVHEHLYCTVREQPYTDVGEVEMVFLQLSELLNRGLLQHVL